MRGSSAIGCKDDSRKDGTTSAGKAGSMPVANGHKPQRAGRDRTDTFICREYLHTAVKTYADDPSEAM